MQSDDTLFTEKACRNRELQNLAENSSFCVTTPHKSSLKDSKYYVDDVSLILDLLKLHATIHGALKKKKNFPHNIRAQLLYLELILVPVQMHYLAKLAKNPQRFVSMMTNLLGRDLLPPVIGSFKAIGLQPIQYQPMVPNEQHSPHQNSFSAQQCLHMNQSINQSKLVPHLWHLIETSDAVFSMA